MIKFSLVGGKLTGTKEYFESRNSGKNLDLDDLIDVSLFYAKLASFSLVKKKKKQQASKSKNLKKILVAIPCTMDFRMDSEAFIAWFEPILYRGYSGFYEIFDKSVNLFFTSIENGCFTILEFKRNFETIDMVVLTEESTKITMETLTGLYDNIKGGT